MIKIMYVSDLDLLSDNQINATLLTLPSITHHEILKYKNTSALKHTLYGRYLLSLALTEMGLPQSTLLGLSKSKFNKPFIKDAFEFNISHSGNLVAIAISTSHSIGIDVELNSNLDLSLFKNCLTNEEWKKIMSSINPNLTFYKLWTQKEAIAKGIGHGLNLALKEIIIEENKCTINEDNWFVKELFLKNNYTAHIAMGKDILDQEISIEEIII